MDRGPFVRQPDGFIVAVRKRELVKYYKFGGVEMKCLNRVSVRWTNTNGLSASRDKLGFKCHGAVDLSLL